MVKKFSTGRPKTEGQQAYLKRVREEYEANSKHCPMCDAVIPYEKRRNKFCSRTCSVINSNTGQIPFTTVQQPECAYCGAITEKRNNKYCDACIKANVYTNKITEVAQAKTDRTRRKILLEIRGYACENCGLSKWLDNNIPLELDHIDGNTDNNIEGNLRLICPNCHALTDNYKGANSGNSSRQKMRRQRYKNNKTY